jgi:hypothetical protein
MATGYDFDLDALFEFGLRRLLDGLAVLIAGRGLGEQPAQVLVEQVVVALPSCKG